MRAPNRIGAWNLNGFEVLALVWALLSSVMFSQALAIIVLKWANVGSKGGELLVSGVALHASIIVLGVVLYVLNAFKVRNGIYGRVGSIQPKWGILYALGAVAFTSALESVWKGFLEALHGLGLIGPLPPVQTIVEVVQSTNNAWVLGGLFLMVSVLAPLSEEWLFRAGFYRYLKSKLTPRVAMIVSALGFADAYERTGCLRTPIVLHALFNSVSFINVLFLGIGA